MKAFRNVRIIDLATHTAGLKRDPPGRKAPDPRKVIFNDLANWIPNYPIGTRYVYSNYSFGVLGYTLSSVTHSKDFYQAIRRTVLDPLEMNSTVIDVPHEWLHRMAVGYPKSGGEVHFKPQISMPDSRALKSTSKDMARFLMANMGLQGPEKLRAAMEFAQKPEFQVNAHLSIGLAWQNVHLPAVNVIDKDGGIPGFNSYIGFTKDKKVGIVILTNHNEPGVTNIGRAILKDLIHE